MLTQERVKSEFRLGEDGLLYWKTQSRNGRRDLTTPAGNNASGYRQVKIDGVLYSVHRVVWLYHTGEWPKNTIDHIDGNKHNNRIENLRDVSQRVNSQAHYSKMLGKTSQYTGVKWHRGNSKWHAQAWHKGKKKHLGYFLDEKDAAKAYQSFVNMVE